MMKSNIRLNAAIGKLTKALNEVIANPHIYSSDCELLKLLENQNRIFSRAKIQPECLHEIEIDDFEASQFTERFFEIEDLRKRALAALSVTTLPQSEGMARCNVGSRIVSDEVRRIFALVYSIRNTYGLLEDVLRSPQSYVNDADFRDALKSQHRLAGLQLTENRIVGLSLNTFKDYSGVVLVGKFQRMDELRKTCIELLETEEHSPKPRKRTLSSLSTRISELEDEIEMLLGDLWNISRAYFKALKNARSYAAESGKPALIARCAAEEDELRAIASLARTGVHLNRKQGE
jgi:hypothetical protein